MIEIIDWNEHFENNRSRELKNLQWVCMPNRHDGDGYTQLLNHKNGVAHFGAWCALVEVASRCDIRGTLVRRGGDAHDPASLARMTRIAESIWKEALPRFLSIGWIKNYEIPQEGAIIPQEGATSSSMNERKEGYTAQSAAPKRSTASAPKNGDGKPFFDFESRLWENIPDDKVKLWEIAYPACDINTELAKMAAWLIENPKKRKTERGYGRFITSWLSRCQDKGGTK